MKYTGWCQNDFKVQGYRRPAELGLPRRRDGGHGRDEHDHLRARSSAPRSEKAAKLAQKLGQLPPFLAVFVQ